MFAADAAAGVAAAIFEVRPQASGATNGQMSRLPVSISYGFVAVGSRISIVSGRIAEWRCTGRSVRRECDFALLDEGGRPSVTNDYSRGISTSSGRGFSRGLPSGSVDWHSWKMRAWHAAHFAASSFR